MSYATWLEKVQDLCQQRDIPFNEWHSWKDDYATNVTPAQAVEAYVEILEEIAQIHEELHKEDSE